MICVLREPIFAVRTACFFAENSYFLRFSKVPSTHIDNTSFSLSTYVQ